MARKTRLGPAAALAAAVAVGAAGAAPAPAPIVHATASGIPDLVVRGPSGTTRLTRNAFYEGLPAWSPDRRRIAYVAAAGRDTDIWVIDAVGSGARRLAGGPGDDLYPAWSPDGRHVAFSRYEDGRGHVYVVRADGTGLRRLTRTGAGVVNAMPTFSPDGRWIAFATSRRGGYELARVRVADGRGFTILTPRGSDHAPDYSPDGRRLVFHRAVDGETSVWIAGADGRGARRLAFHEGRNATFPRFSPDGRHVLYTVARPADEGAKARLWRVEVSTGTRTELGPGAEGDW